MNINDYIKQICNILHIKLPKIIKKQDLNELYVNYISDKKTIYIKRDIEINYSLIYQIVLAIRFYYQDINCPNTSKQQRIEDAIKFAEIYFDKYMDIKLIIDEKDLTLSNKILK